MAAKSKIAHARHFSRQFYPYNGFFSENKLFEFRSYFISSIRNHDHKIQCGPHGGVIWIIYLDLQYFTTAENHAGSRDLTKYLVPYVFLRHRSQIYNSGRHCFSVQKQIILSNRLVLVKKSNIGRITFIL